MDLDKRIDEIMEGSLNECLLFPPIEKMLRQIAKEVAQDCLSLCDDPVDCGKITQAYDLYIS